VRILVPHLGTCGVYMRSLNHGATGPLPSMRPPAPPAQPQNRVALALRLGVMFVQRLPRGAVRDHRRRRVDLDAAPSICHVLEAPENHDSKHNLTPCTT
jgi:hypothetical protein